MGGGDGGDGDDDDADDEDDDDINEDDDKDDHAVTHVSSSRCIGATTCLHHTAHG